MDFLRSYFGTNKPDFFPHFLTGLLYKHGKPVKKCSTGQRFICTEVTSYKIHTLVGILKIISISEDYRIVSCDILSGHRMTHQNVHPTTQGLNGCPSLNYCHVITIEFNAFIPKIFWLILDRFLLRLHYEITLVAIAMFLL